MESSKKKGIIVLIALGLSIFGYSQYASASNIEISIVRSEMLNENEHGTNYDIELQFINPSLLVLAAGSTDFFIKADDEIIGQGQLEPFTLQPLDTSNVRGIFHTISDSDDSSRVVKIIGVTKYDVLFTSIDVPFAYVPSEEQAREFIHHG